MKRLIFSALLCLVGAVAMAQPRMTYQEKVVYEGEDVTFRQIDAHTWEGNGKMMANETLYIVEGEERALLIDAGTNIKDLDKIVAGITSKPVTLVATHVHPDHTGASVNYFKEIYINAADMVNVKEMMGDYKGEIKYLSDGEVIDLGGREIEVVFTPGHTPGSTTFIDRKAGYGFSGDAFGSGNLLLTTNFTTLALTCQRMSEYMQKHNISKLKRVHDMLQMSRDVLAGKVEGRKNERGMLGLDRVLTMHGVNINYGAAQVK